jgi:hypothetical protein
MTTTLLITTAVNPPPGIPYLALTNPSMRALSSKAALYFWITKGLRKIVIADATETQLLTDHELRDIVALGVQIEQLAYAQNVDEVRARGKGYGEGKLIEFALHNSALLKTETRFFKSSGKTFVRNFREISGVIDTHRISTIFWKGSVGDDLWKSWADARFFYTTKDFALKHLVPCYLQSDDKSAACEFQICEMLSRTASFGYAVRPLIHGLSGYAGEDYPDISLGFLDSNFPCWFKND